jgi:hypothetical protein
VRAIAVAAFFISLLRFSSQLPHFSFCCRVFHFVAAFFISLLRLFFLSAGSDPAVLFLPLVVGSRCRR